MGRRRERGGTAGEMEAEADALLAAGVFFVSRYSWSHVFFCLFL